MENHPIPQDVTGFQFKLVGNMTVKQFAFVGAGIVIAVLLYYAPNPGSFLITLLKFILVPISGLSGLVAAFIPIEGRPVDVMLGNFFKALFAPNQYIYKKTGRHFAVSTLHLRPVTKSQQAKDSMTQQATRLREQQLQSYLSAVQQAPKNSLDEKEAAFLQSVSQQSVQAVSQPVSPLPTASPPPPTLSPSISTPPIPVASPDKEDQHGEHLKSSDLTPEQKEVELEQKEAQLKKEIEQSQHEETTPGKTPQATYVAHLHTVDLGKQLNDVLTQKQQLEQELMQLKDQLRLQKQTEPATPLATQSAQPDPQSLPQETKESEQHVRKIPRSLGKNVGLPNTPDVANLIVGIIRDPRGNVLNNILVEVKDKEGNPVRAFKSNTLGQFASATQLPVGTYTITFEDPKGEHTFDVIEMNVKGEIIEPIEVISHDAREELRKALFN